MQLNNSKNIDQNIRIAAFSWLSDQVEIYGDVLPRDLIAKGFIFENKPIPLVSPQGIFKPKILDYPLTITTAPESHYDDGVGAAGFLLYRYRGTDPNHPDNIGLIQALKKNLPLIYFHGIVPGKYLAIWPVYIIGDEPKNLTFKVALDDISTINNFQHKQDDLVIDESTEIRRAYITSTVRRRLHQRSFREKVLSAYQSQCALCRIKHLELLDAAHIIPDTEPDSKSTVNNGIALCKLHHAAFDSFILGISPDFIIEIRKDILDEEDGPMLQHGLKGLHLSRIVLPKSHTYWPDQELLEIRHQKFKKAI